jgi:trigger factor
MIDPREVAEEAAEQIIRKTLKLAIEEQQLKPDQSQPPAVDLTKLERENDACEYTVKVPLPPIIELGAYKGLPLEKPAIEVSEEDVSYQIDEMRRRKSTKEAVTDRGVQEGDVAMVNLKVEGDEGDGRNFMTVAGQTFPQLDEALMGMTVEEFKQIELTFPDKFQEKDWAGKTLKARLLLNSISTVKLPEIEDFAKSLQLEGSDDLNQKMREAILRAAKKQGSRRSSFPSRLS